MIGAKTKIGPLVGKARFVFYLNIEAGQLGLIAAMLVDRPVRGRFIDLENEHGFVWPFATGDEGIVGGRGDKDIGEHLHAVRALAVAHAEAGGDVYPFSIALGSDQLAVFCELGSSGLRLGFGFGENQAR